MAAGQLLLRASRFSRRLDHSLSRLVTPVSLLFALGAEQMAAPLLARPVVAVVIFGMQSHWQSPLERH